MKPNGISDDRWRKLMASKRDRHPPPYPSNGFAHASRNNTFLACSPALSGSQTMVASERGRRCGASSRRRTGLAAFALISRTKPSLISLALTLLRVAPLHRVRCREATVIALRGGAHHHKLRIGKFDARDPTPPPIQEARLSGPVTRTSPGSRITPHIPSECARLLVRPPPR